MITIEEGVELNSFNILKDEAVIVGKIYLSYDPDDDVIEVMGNYEADTIYWTIDPVDNSFLYINEDAVMVIYDLPLLEKEVKKHLKEA